jgi:retron-type reverse transcriptase
MKIQLGHKFEDIVCLDNLLSAWQEFIVGKKNKKDFLDFGRNLFDNILSLHTDLASGNYRHGGYESFFVNDPKRRHIHKASVRDRLLHHAVYRILYPFFDKKFISDSYSCRLEKGTHKAINRFRAMAYAVSKNHTRTCWVLKCDIRKFFASIDHCVLIGILRQYIEDEKIMGLLEDIIHSYYEGMVLLVNREILSASRQIAGVTGQNYKDGGVGLPLGNLTSQLFANIYMNEFDQWVKHRLRIKNYIRYADDFVFLSEEKDYLEMIIPAIAEFLKNRLKLTLHPDKVFIKTIASGVDFLGWINFCDYRILRGVTKRRMFGRINDDSSNNVLQSYLGLLRHGNCKKVSEELLMRVLL